jgi:activating signal cointegrator complex subunit 3
MIFVHSRKETSRTAEAMRDLAGRNGTTNLLENIHHEQYDVWKRAVEKSRSQEVQQLFYQGLGIHHAGMLRSTSMHALKYTHTHMHIRVQICINTYKI